MLPWMEQVLHQLEFHFSFACIRLHLAVWQHYKCAELLISSFGLYCAHGCTDSNQWMNLILK